MSTDPGETKEFEFLGFRCDRKVLKQLEPKTLSKTGIFYEFRYFLSFFGSSCFKASWAHLEPRKSNSLVSPGSVDPPWHPWGVLIAE